MQGYKGHELCCLLTEFLNLGQQFILRRHKIAETLSKINFFRWWWCCRKQNNFH